MTNVEIAEKFGAEIGTWDKSGNGNKLISFSLSEFNSFAEHIRQEPNELANINAELNSKLADLEWMKNDHFKLCEILNGMESADLENKTDDSINVKALKDYIKFSIKNLKANP